MLKNARDLIASGDTKLVVDFAIETYRSVLAENEELDVAKQYIRKIAETEYGKKIAEKTVSVAGNLGVATVTFPKPGPQVRRGVDLLACSENLSADILTKLFVKKTVIEFAPDFEAKLASLSAHDRAVIENLVEIVPSTPRVNLPR